MTDLRPVMAASSETATLSFLGLDQRVLIPAAATGGALSGMDSGEVPAGFAPPLHEHLREHELFIVGSGAVRFQAGEMTQVVEGFGMAFLPATLPHSFRVLSTARMAVVTLPAGLALAGDFERFVTAVSTATPSTPGSDQEVFGMVAELGAQYDIPIIGPPPAMKESA